MVSLDLGKFNALSPYRVAVWPGRQTYRFRTDYGVVCDVHFIEEDLLRSCTAYQIAVANANNKKSPRDPKLRDTILAIIDEFFEENIAALLYICETDDDKQLYRSRLFNYWFNTHPRHALFSIMMMSIPDEEGVDNCAAIIVRGDNLHMHAIVLEFADTMRILGDKP